MCPTILKIGPLTIYSYGLMLAVAVILCSVLLSREARALGIAVETIYDLVFWTVLGGLLGARIFYVLLNLDFFLEAPREIILIQKGGLAWQGGLILGTVTAVVYIQRKRLGLLRMVDLMAPYIALGQAIGRIGCFLNGCCYGREVAWGIYFPVHQARLHPAQLYSSAGLIAAFFILKRFQKTQHQAGQVFVLYLILASFLRFIVEFFRADHAVLWAGLSVFQIVCLGIALSAMVFCLWVTRRPSGPRT